MAVAWPGGDAGDRELALVIGLLEAAAEHGVPGGLLDALGAIFL